MNQAANQIAREQIKEIAERVSAAAAANSPLAIRGGGSKNFYGNPSTGETLEVGAIRGIAAYEPGELFATVYAGTPLSELHRTLAERGQMLAFEPPSFAESATVGGAAACGFSGPRRPSAGALRDFVLGIGVVDGSGDILKFGGEVMKNVAGFDVSRLMAARSAPWESSRTSHSNSRRFRRWRRLSSWKNPPPIPSMKLIAQLAKVCRLPQAHILMKTLCARIGKRCGGGKNGECARRRKIRKGKVGGILGKRPRASPFLFCRRK